MRSQISAIKWSNKIERYTCLFGLWIAPTPNQLNLNQNWKQCSVTFIFSFVTDIYIVGKWWQKEFERQLQLSRCTTLSCCSSSSPTNLSAAHVSTAAVDCSGLHFLHCRDVLGFTSPTTKRFSDDKIETLLLMCTTVCTILLQCTAYSVRWTCLPLLNCAQYIAGSCCRRLHAIVLHIAASHSHTTCSTAA